MGADDAAVRRQVLSTVDRWRGIANATQDPRRALSLRAAANSVERVLADLGTTAAVVAVTREAAALARPRGAELGVGAFGRGGNVEREGCPMAGEARVETREEQVLRRVREDLRQWRALAASTQDPVYAGRLRLAVERVETVLRQRGLRDAVLAAFQESTHLTGPSKHSAMADIELGL